MKMARVQALDGGYDEPMINDHKVIYKMVREPQSLKDWLIYQALTLNLTNIALLITVVVLSSSIGSKIDAIHAQNDIANERILKLTQQLNDAHSVLVSLATYNDILVSFNETLNEAVSDGLPQLVNLSARVESTSMQLATLSQRLDAASTDMQRQIKAVNQTYNSLQQQADATDARTIGYLYKADGSINLASGPTLFVFSGSAIKVYLSGSLLGELVCPGCKA